ncbi:hypothetical protein FKG94_10100 [Exilibacterium tricleocarpae]|uniref:Uncharacterized protein n=1 Tax=Exilibacterium tricleocarpae TaxID=2591008 RepID=A0A545TUZ5_9GAMM|nr:hypothetical protein [Exilibacterium tricleocarpae]TQV81038.1 hypothetical protein FKG94_10100 [Exilibacterium tricleocarpae]
MEQATNNNELRRTFIAMLFALVVATLAQRFADILFLVTKGWSIPIFSPDIFLNLIKNDWLLAAPFTHASLGLILVSASWVGWSKSKAAGHQNSITSLLSIPFFLLLIEVMLVTIYFGIAVSIEVNIKDYSSQGIDSDFVFQASALPEAMQLVAVFSIFLVWDILADVISSPLGAREHPHLITITAKQKSIGFLTGTLTYGFSSILCLILCYVVFWLYPVDATPRHAVYGDLSLIAVIGIFHSTKCLEAYIIRLFPWEGTRSNSPREIPLTSGQISKIITSVSLYVFFITLLCITATPCP